MNKSILTVIFFISTLCHAQINVFGHYENPSVSKHLLHLRPDSTYVLYYISDIGPFPRTQYEEVVPKQFEYKNGKIYLINETTGFDSIFVLVDSVNLIPKTNPNPLEKKVFYYDDGTIKYFLKLHIRWKPYGKGYQLKHYHENSLISITHFVNKEKNGEYIEYYPMDDPLNSEWYKTVLAESDSLNWNKLTAFMDLNSEFYQVIKVKGSWLNGQKNGKWVYYNKEGDIERKEKYKLGELKTSR